MAGPHALRSAPLAGHDNVIRWPLPLTSEQANAIVAGALTELTFAGTKRPYHKLKRGDVLWCSEPFLYLTVKRQVGVEGISYGSVPSHTPRPDYLRNLDCKVAVCSAKDMMAGQSRIWLQLKSVAKTDDGVKLTFERIEAQRGGAI